MTSGRRFREPPRRRLLEAPKTRWKPSCDRQAKSPGAPKTTHGRILYHGVLTAAMPSQTTRRVMLGQTITAAGTLALAPQASGAEKFQAAQPFGYSLNTSTIRGQ